MGVGLVEFGCGNMTLWLWLNAAATAVHDIQLTHHHLNTTSTPSQHPPQGDLDSFLVEITAQIFTVKDDKAPGYLVDKILDKTGLKGTGKWTVQEAADLSVAAPTMEAALGARFLSGRKQERVRAAAVFTELGLDQPVVSKVV